MCSYLGQPLVFDAARISPAHRLRAYWTNFGPTAPPPLAPGRDLAAVLQPTHRPNLCPYSDRLPMEPFNVRGAPMRKYPTIMRRHGHLQHEERRGPGLVTQERAGKL